MTLEALLEARPSRRNDLGTWYSQLLEAAAREGTSVAALADLLGCARETIYAWKRRLAKAADAAAPPPGLVRVRVAREAKRDEERFEVRLRSGRSVLVPNSFEPLALAAVVAALEQC